MDKDEKMEDKKESGLKRGPCLEDAIHCNVFHHHPRHPIKLDTLYLSYKHIQVSKTQYLKYLNNVLVKIYKTLIVYLHI
jgi:hypothetical protein